MCAQRFVTSRSTVEFGRGALGYLCGRGLGQLDENASVNITAPPTGIGQNALPCGGEIAGCTKHTSGARSGHPIRSVQGANYHLKIGPA